MTDTLFYLNYSEEINAPVTCRTNNIIYIITSNKKECKNIQYIGESGKKLNNVLINIWLLFDQPIKTYILTSVLYSDFIFTDSDFVDN